jgi:hypothetical protein
MLIAQSLGTPNTNTVSEEVRREIAALQARTRARGGNVSGAFNSPIAKIAVTLGVVASVAAIITLLRR